LEYRKIVKFFRDAMQSVEQQRLEVYLLLEK
jgi:hypothetical protein